MMSSPSPNPSKPNVLSGVTCPSASLCWAIRYTNPTNFSGSLTEKWERHQVGGRAHADLQAPAN